MGAKTRRFSTVRALEEPERVDLEHMGDAVLLSEGVYVIGGPVSVPELLTGIDCPQAKGAGPIRVQGVIGADGIPCNLRVIDPVSPALATVAVNCVSSWRFEPALKDGEPVAVGVTFHINGPSYPALI
jgi:hypothetical protein